MQKLLNAGPSSHGWHGLGLALRCPRLYAWNKQHPKDDFRLPLVKGSLVHQGLAHFYQRIQNQQEGSDPNEWYTPEESIAILARTEAEKTGFREWLDWVEWAQVAVAQYEMYWGQEEFKVLAVEHEMWAHVRDEKNGVVYPYTQRADLITEDSSGKVTIWDHKTTARMTSSTVSRYAMTGQMIGYSVLGKGLWGERFAGVVLNMLELKKDFPDQTANFSRWAADSVPYSSERFKKTILHANRVIDEYKDLPVGDWPGSHLSTGCVTNFGPCDYQSECRWGF